MYNNLLLPVLAVVFICVGRGEALLWQSGRRVRPCAPPLPAHRPRYGHGHHRYGHGHGRRDAASLLVDLDSHFSGDGDDAAVLIPSTTVAKLCHRSEVWCVAFSPDGEMLATAEAEGGVKLWLLDRATGGLPRAVDCLGAAKAPLLLRWDPHSSAVLCCCQESRAFFRWNVLPAVGSAELSRLGCSSRDYDQSYEVVFADFLPSCSSEEVLISCTIEGHIFICDSDNKPLATCVGGDGEVSSAAVVPLELRVSSRHKHTHPAAEAGQKHEQSGWCPRNQSSGVSSSFAGSCGPEGQVSQCGLLVANAKNNEISLFQIIVRCGQSETRPHVYEIVPTASLPVELPVVSLAEYVGHACNEWPGSDTPLALVTLLGGLISDISIQVRNHTFYSFISLWLSFFIHCNI
jgi:hypothetical protein